MIKDINFYMDERKEQFSCAKEIRDAIDEGYRFVAVMAPVKSGKKDISISFHLLYSGDKNVNSYYVTSLVLNDCKPQYEEYLNCGFIDAKALARKTAAKEIINDIQKKLKNPNSRVFIHLDESDYGTENNSTIDKIWDEYKNNKNVCFIFFSATNEEILKSPIKDKIKTIQFKPNKNYKGASFYLENNLVNEAESFISEQGNLSSQGESIIDDFIQNGNDRFLGFVRLTQKVERKHLVKIKETLKLKKLNVHIIDGKSKAVWSSNEKNEEWRKAKQIFDEDRSKTIYILNQTATRSTEFNCHKYIYFWHDYRSDKTSYNTIAQAVLRVAHYDEFGHKIKIYADSNSMALAAAKIEDSDYARKLSSRVNKETKESSKYTIKQHYFENIEEIKNNFPTSNYTHQNVETHPSKDLLRYVLNGRISTENDEKQPIVVCNKQPCEKFVSSFEEACQKYPEIKEKYCVFEYIKEEVVKECSFKHETNVKKSMYDLE